MNETAKHAITRVRHEPRRRLLTVQRVEKLSPNMTRITLGGDLQGFISSGYDDHVKVFFPLPGRTPQHLRFAIACCQNFGFGHFNSYRQMAADDLDQIGRAPRLNSSHRT